MAKKKTKKQNKSLCQSFLRKDNLIRDIIIVAVVIGLSALFINRKLLYEKLTVQREVGRITEEAAQNEAEDSTIDTTEWEKFQSQWYGFELKYPEGWEKPVLKTAIRGSKWEYRFQFRKKELVEDNLYIGLDVVVYNVRKVKELSNTDEFPAVKNEELKAQGACQEIGGHFAENENYPAEQIYIGPNDDCYEQAYFYTIIRDEYIYNIVPIVEREMEKTFQLESEIIKEFPEFIALSSTFNLIDIKRPKPVAVKPKITAPMPAAAVKRDSQGRLVCAKKSDHPGKSHKGKGKHLDMECCLDPDEYPNPHCYYSPDKYGKYL